MAPPIQHKEIVQVAVPAPLVRGLKLLITEDKQFSIDAVAVPAPLVRGLKLPSPRQRAPVVPLNVAVPAPLVRGLKLLEVQVLLLGRLLVAVPAPLVRGLKLLLAGVGSS